METDDLGTERVAPEPEPLVPVVPPQRPFSIAVDVVCFLCELALLVLLALAGWSLGNGGLLGICLAVLYPALAVLVWGVWLAPKSPDCLDDPARFVVQVLIFLATAAASALSGHLVVGVVFAVVAIGAFAETRILDR